MRRFPGTLLLLIGVIVLTLAIVSLRDDPTVFGMAKDDFARASYLAVILVAVAAGIVGRGSLAQAVRHSLSWVIVMAALLAGYSYRDDLAWVGRKVLAELVPGLAMLDDRPAVTDNQTPVTIVRALSGQFRIQTVVNGETVSMLVDTGASVVTLTAEDALRAGLDPEALNYGTKVFTANGVTEAARVTLDSLKVGTIERSRVLALVARPGRLDRSLLGMSFLNTLSSYTVSGDRLTLTP